MTIKEIDLNLLKQLSEADGIGGCEREVSRIVKRYGEPFIDESYYDNLGSIILHKKGAGPKVMLSSHMDEVGFMVRQITPEGYLRLLPVGGWWGHVMPAQEMRVTTMSGEKYIGVVGSRAPHGMPLEEKSKVFAPMDFYLDMGVKDAQTIQEMGIAIGDMITPNTTFRQMNDPEYLMGKAWDDRVCVGVGLEVLRNLQEPVADVYFAATVQEEVGIRGARTAVHSIKPDVAIALDVTTAQDTPFDSGGLRLGDGCILSVLDSLTIANRGLLEHMEQLIKEQKLNVRYDFMTVGGTDACNIHKAMEGVVTMTLSLPTRYMHSSRLLIHQEDYRQTIQLLTTFIQSLTMADIQLFKESLRHG
ncbi:peptidase M28 [Enterococcus canis]|uniref:Peptidase M28 n=1 Tax=Enterococcus canis TaxID=214095 RepID=A0A1L8REV0_9ENTE|nr:M42 family metallopeptidase [Enterococcus canis]OJG18212.1 peptidase M28 [Enterococcus canis]